MSVRRRSSATRGLLRGPLSRLRPERLGRSRRGERPRGAPASRYDRIPDPPACPPGWRVAPPDFIIVGAQKSGTTWWQGLIETHPGVLRPKGQRRELHYFDHFWDRWPTADQLRRYHDYFPRPDGTLAGEKTPGYLYQAWVPPMLAAAAPAAKVIVLLRDPVARYVSGLGLLLRSGALEAPPGEGDVGRREQRVPEAIERGRYASQLRWLLRSFPFEHVLVLQYERCVADPQGQLDRTFAFLGLPPHTVSGDEVARARKRSSEAIAVPDRLRTLLADYYRPEVEDLLIMVPDLDPLLWPAFADLSRPV